ncbi:MAG: hypothetical protein PHP62_05395 [Candidatus Moranbacteria bacterium]|nr:hypothetical protein [Candidatus Moranbacteria bacterium]
MKNTTRTEAEKNQLLIKPYTQKELSFLYGVCGRTFKKWLKPYRRELGVHTGRFYMARQVKKIFEKLGFPDSKSPSTAPPATKMKSEILIVFSTYYKNIPSKTVDLPVIPRTGEWFSAEDFLSKKEKKCYEKRSGYEGVFYVRMIQHWFLKKEVQTIALEVCLTEQDDYYDTHYGDK